MTARSSSSNGPPVWRRTAVWVPVALATVLLPLGLFFGLRWARGPSAAERAVLRNLEIYDVRYEMDESNRIGRVVLEGKHVTDDALDEVRLLPYLQDLSLHGSSVTDAGLAKLSGMKRLQKLGLTDTKVTDRGLKTLEQMPSLQYIWLCENGRLTSRGIVSLCRALPAARVYVMNRPDRKPSGEPPKSTGNNPLP
jgi:hypothetical protein